MPRGLPAPRIYRSGPWQGMRFSTATATDRAQFAELLSNVYLRDTDTAPVAVGRPGFTRLGAGGGVGTQLGAGGTRNCQVLYQYSRQDGTEFSVEICGGKFYTYNAGTDQFTETLTTANLTSAAVTLSTTVRVHAVTFANKVIFSDGVNTPWMWDGTAGAGITKLTNCPAIYGQPWLYNGRLFGIKGTSTAARISVMWSESGDPTLGYDTAPYTNIWDVAQTAQAVFVAGAATNESIVLCRANSATRLTGDVGSAFASTANREGVHEYVGTISQSGMLVHQDTVYFMANDGRIMRVRPGGIAIEIAVGVREFIQSYSPAKFNIADAMVWDAGSSGEYLLWAVSSSTANNPDTVLVVDPRSGELCGVWTGWQQTRFGSWKDASGNPVLVHGGGSVATTDADGYTYLHGTPTSTVWTDGLNAGTANIAHAVTSHAMAGDESNDKYWDVSYVSLLVPSSISGVGVQAKTPYTTTTPTTFVSILGGGGIWGQFVWGTGLWGGGVAARQGAVGLGEAGRWCQLNINHSTSGEQFALQSVAALAYPDTSSPLIA